MCASSRSWTQPDSSRRAAAPARSARDRPCRRGRARACSAANVARAARGRAGPCGDAHRARLLLQAPRQLGEDGQQFAESRPGEVALRGSPFCVNSARMRALECGAGRPDPSARSSRPPCFLARLAPPPPAPRAVAQQPRLPEPIAARCAGCSSAAMLRPQRPPPTARCPRACRPHRPARSRRACPARVEPLRSLRAAARRAPARA